MAGGGRVAGWGRSQNNNNNKGPRTKRVVESGFENWEIISTRWGLGYHKPMRQRRADRSLDLLFKTGKDCFFTPVNRGPKYCKKNSD